MGVERREDRAPGGIYSRQMPKPIAIISRIRGSGSK